MDIKEIDKNEMIGLIEKSADISEKILKPIYSFLPNFIVEILASFTPFHIILACISRFSLGIFIGCTFPNFFKKHRIKILLIAIISALPVLKKVFSDK
ncbi:MAG: hypothetical protein M0R46_03200 [Candidatus Muirbacterium halophilum]|nr:hypothetical protein [Candidatus Muirbacterium halophilum]MCK9474895.1 hypothetical protein [Candidatus Muirbacterium halophilum]